jgi:hypothetical protein
MLRTFVAAVFGCLLFAAPVLAASSCMTWEDGIRVAAEYSHEADDRIAAVLLTEEETQATWAALFPGKDGAPVRLGVMVSQCDPGTAFVAGFDAAGSLPFGPVLDAMVATRVASTFVIVEPAAKGVGA